MAGAGLYPGKFQMLGASSASGPMAVATDWDEGVLIVKSGTVSVVHRGC